MTKMKKSKKEEIILKSDKSFDELLDDAFNDKQIKTLPKKEGFKKRNGEVRSKDGNVNNK